MEFRYLNYSTGNKDFSGVKMIINDLQLSLPKTAVPS
jgi:hypothetical protein